MVTLLGFFFILGNIILIEIYVPELVGPVSINCTIRFVLILRKF